MLEYSLRYNTTRRGFWISSPPLPGWFLWNDRNDEVINDSIHVLDSQLNSPYTQFTGTLQVMKAVGNHLVLTFCQTIPKGHLFSVILSRKPNTLTHEVRILKLRYPEPMFRHLQATKQRSINQFETFLCFRTFKVFAICWNDEAWVHHRFEKSVLLAVHRPSNWHCPRCCW